MKKIRPKVTGATALATARTDCCLLCGASNNPAYLRRHSSPTLNLRYRDDAMELTAVDGPGQRTCYTFDKSAVGTYIFSCKEDADEALAKLRNGRNPAASESEVAK